MPFVMQRYLLRVGPRGGWKHTTVEANWGVWYHIYERGTSKCYLHISMLPSVRPTLTSHRMISTNITTALILESDADWDLRIASILSRFPPAIAEIVDFPFPSNPRFPPSASIASPLLPPPLQPSHHIPYGTAWDILWFGHCGSSHEGFGRIYSWNDSTVPPEGREYVFDIGLQGDQHIPGTRALYQFGRTTCSTGYAITLRGAMKLVKYFREADSNLDIQLSSVCTRHADMTCLGVWPQVITAALTASNIDHSGEGDSAGGSGENVKEAHPLPGPALQFSARVNAKGLLEEGKGWEDWKAEWDAMFWDREGEWAEVPLDRSLLFGG